MKRILIVFSIVFVAAAVYGQSAHGVVAAGDSLSAVLPDVTVTAIKQTVTDAGAATMTTVTRRDVERDHIVSAKLAADLVPNFFMPDYGSRMTSSIYIRGLGARIDQPVMGLNVDNVPVMCKENYDLDIMDISRVEVLRGPQSTLFGRNTMGGVMNIYTLSPFQYEGTRILAEYASHDAMKFGVSHYATLSPKFGISASAYYTSTAGEYRNQYNGKLVDWERQGNGRVRFEWLPTATFTVSNTLSASVNRQGGYPYQYVATGEISYNDTCFYRRTSVLDALTLRKTFSRMTLSSITCYQFIDDNMTLDQDFTPQPYFTLTQARREHAVTQDVVATGSGDALKWLTGAFGFYRSFKMDAPVTFKDTGIAELIENHSNAASPSYPIKWDGRQFVLGSHFTNPTWGAALYHQSTMTFGNLAVTAGLRLDYEHATLRYHSETHTSYGIYQLATGTLYSAQSIDIDERGTLKRDFTQLLPRLALTYKAFSREKCDLDLFASASKGYKAGGFNTQMFSDVLQQRLMGMMGIGARYNVDDIVGYKPEVAWNYEAGARLTTGNVSATASAFYIDCRDRQMTVFPDGTTTGRIMTNAGKTRSTGVEAELHVTNLVAGIDLNANYGFTHVTFVRYNDGKADYHGKRVPYCPEQTLFVQALRTFAAGECDITLDANLRGAGRIYWNEANTLSQPFYALLGASVTCAWCTHSLQLWGQNLTDTRFNTFHFVSIGHDFLQRGKGAAIGATLRVNL